MRFRHRDGRTVHLGYCTNVHPGERLSDIVAQLHTHALPVRQALAVDRLGVGLWLPAAAAAELTADPGAVRRLRRELDSRGLEVVTLNGFPYRAFHAPVVKRDVYRPDWTTERRLEYTVALARILSGLMPDDAAYGSVSTLPLGWRAGWTPVRAAAAAHVLDRLTERLKALHQATGRVLRVGFEPEPGCVVETTAQAVVRLSGLDPEYLGLCLDLAHLACGWEQPAAALTALAAVGLPVVKAQLSVALGVGRPDLARAALIEYAEPRFLHQTRNPAGQGTDDLAEAIDSGLAGPWRIHYHVPLHAAPQPPLHATTDVLRAGLAELVGGPTALCDHLEVETYTWDVLPAAARPRGVPGLVEGIAAELRFAAAEITALDLRPERSAPVHSQAVAP